MPVACRPADFDLKYQLRRVLEKPPTAINKVVASSDMQKREYASKKDR